MNSLSATVSNPWIGICECVFMVDHSLDSVWTEVLVCGSVGQCKCVFSLFVLQCGCDGQNN